jgi:acetyl esterase/lipase
VIASATVSLAARCRIVPNRSYDPPRDPSRTLDLHKSASSPRPRRAFLFFHGGGWVTGTKESSALHLLPWLEAGWAAINVEYRKAREARAPAAAHDARRALRWVWTHADEDGLDADGLLLGGMSSGGHLALLAATRAALPSEVDRPASDPPDRLDPVPVRAVVNWFGISDVAALLRVPRPKAFARHWIGSRPDALDPGTSPKEEWARAYEAIFHFLREH